MGGGNRGGWIRGRCLGRGSTAAVYLAVSNSGVDREIFAVKSAELSRSSPLQREERILSSVCSPHVVSCLGSDVTVEPDGRALFNLFVEYVPGGDLAAVVKRQGGLDESTIVQYTRGVLNGVAYLHGREIVHCDVKAHNVLVGEDGGDVKLADLGSARWMEDGCQGRGIMRGTPLYMAPEVVRGEEQGPAADIWALGCTLIEMATGCPPWRDVQDPVAAVHRIAFSDDVPEFPCSLSDDAMDFLGRCLSREPRARWSAEELLGHPFLRRSGGLPKEYCSPKSTLDVALWDSCTEEEELEGEDEAQTANQPPRSAQERLRHLAGAGGLPPSHLAAATWDDYCWISIRDAQGPEPSTSGSSPAVAALAHGVSREESSPGQGDAAAVARDGSIGDVCNSGSSPSETYVHEADGLVEDDCTCFNPFRHIQQDLP